MGTLKPKPIYECGFLSTISEGVLLGGSSLDSILARDFGLIAGVFFTTRRAGVGGNFLNMKWLCILPVSQGNGGGCFSLLGNSGIHRMGRWFLLCVNWSVRRN